MTVSRPLPLKGRWVLVTGASSGLGEEMARQLARDHGANLVLVARREDRLRVLAEELEASRPGVRTRVVAADLTDPGAVDRVAEESVAEGPLGAAILNAGVTYFGKHTELDADTFAAILATNVTAVVRLASALVPAMVRAGDGGLLLVSSMAGLLPVPYQAAYCGTKGFVTNFGLALAEELHDAPVSITVFSPGGIATEMTHDSKLRHFESGPFVQSAEDCAREGLAAFVARKRLAVPGRLNRVQLLATRFVPRTLSVAITRRAYEPALRLPDR